MGMKKIKVGDTVYVTTGKDKTRTGDVIRFVGDKLVVAGINMVKKHQKPNPQKQIEGGIIEKEMPLHISNVAIYNPQTNKPDRVGIKVLEAQAGERPRKVRVFKSNNEQIDI